MPLEQRYFKRPWDGSRGDEHDDWGTSTWFFEVGQDGYVRRQIEVYEAGQVLKYDRSHMQDAYGMLAESKLKLVEDGFLPFEIECAEFELAWRTYVSMNRS